MKFLIFLILLFPCLSFAQIPVKEINGEEVWQGQVIIDGIVAVRNEGKLIIKEGTEVVFKTIDIDNDGIGDSELYVEGEIYVYGSENLPVIFTSDEPIKEPSQWKYVMVNHAKYAYFEYAIFESAFSGLQIHFSKGVVKNCIFRSNVDGFRFSTSNIYVCKNIMTKNKHGIRYEERDSKGIVEYNHIFDNEIGIFPVTACNDNVIFQYNVIEKNGYNIKVGDEQKKDLTFKKNYFGMIFEKDIKKTIYDKSYDKHLPKINFKPFLKKNVLRSNIKCLENGY